MATMRCTMAHWQGHEFIDTGTLIDSGDARLIPEFFTPVEDTPKPRAKKTAAKPEPDEDE